MNTNRRRGADTLVLDANVLLAAARENYAEEAGLLGHGPTPHMLLPVDRAVPAIVNGQGVGTLTNDDGETIGVYFTHGRRYAQLTLTLSQVVDADSGTWIDLADGIRTFDHLDANHNHWFDRYDRTTARIASRATEQEETMNTQTLLIADLTIGDYSYGDCILEGDRYETGAAALTLSRVNGAPVATVTVNITHTSNSSSTAFYVKDYGENSGIAAALETRVIIAPTGHTAQLTFDRVAEYHLTADYAELLPN